MEEKTISTVNEFIKELEKLYSKNPARYHFYRGEENAEWKSLPSILRKTNLGKEKEYREKVLAEYPEEYHSLESIDVLAKIQHYFSHTRLLEVTANPLTALYFACAEHLNKNGAVYIYSSDTLLSYESDKAYMLAMLSKFPQEDQNNIRKVAIEFLEADLLINKSNINGLDPELQRSLINFIYALMRERSDFANFRINPAHLLQSYFVKPAYNNKRTQNQEGAYILFGLENDNKKQIPYLSPDAKNNNITSLKIVVDKEAKTNIINQLKILNITKSKLFPDIQNALFEL
ncbi:MAG: FRG domain-containing protein [Bacillales bacterium]|jgi:hypothetical protein|nr:FRG domain-containing protein [Bacillales bacterium]